MRLPPRNPQSFCAQSQGGRTLDRFDTMKVFVAVLDEGGLSNAARRLGRSSAAVSRSLADLEARLGVALLYRTTRSIRLSDAGERYASACRTILAALDEAERAAAGESSDPRGTLTITAPVAAGELALRPIIDAFMRQHPAICVRLHLLDRMANLIDEGFDLALRIAHLPDSNLTAVKLGEVRRVVAASPAYLARSPAVETPSDLVDHDIIAMTHFGIDTWSFAPATGTSVARVIQFQPKFIVNSIRSAVASAVDGGGILRVFSYHIAEELESGALHVVLADAEGPSLPAHLIAPQGRLQIPKARAFADFAVPRLRSFFQRSAALCAGSDSRQSSRDAAIDAPRHG
jgi:DNA-binding transcriptional LysR family regulator